MRHWCVRSLILAVCGVGASCATDEQRAIEAGEIPLLQSEIAKIFPGNTVRGRGPGGQVIIYYHKDGRKLKREANEVIQRAWWVNDIGQWCETIVEDESKRICGPAIYKNGHGLTWYSEYGEAIGSYFLVAGDPESIRQHDHKLRQASNPETLQHHK